MVVVNLFTNQKGEALEGFEDTAQSIKEAEEKKRIEQEAKRVHYEIPTYEKFYTLYRYDADEFRVLLNKWLDTPEGKKRTLSSLRRKQQKILEECYLRDEYGKVLDKDESHIFRYSSLNYEPKFNAKDKRAKAGLHQAIFEELQNRGFISLLTVQERVGHTYAPSYIELECYEWDGLMIHPDEKQAEIKETWQLPLEKRVKKHLRLLRFLRNLDDNLVYGSLKGINSHTGFVIDRKSLKAVK